MKLCKERERCSCSEQLHLLRLMEHPAPSSLIEYIHVTPGGSRLTRIATAELLSGPSRNIILEGCLWNPRPQGALYIGFSGLRLRHRLQLGSGFRSSGSTPGLQGPSRSEPQEPSMGLVLRTLIDPKLLTLNPQVAIPVTEILTLSL